MFAMHGEKVLDVAIAKQFLLIEAEDLKCLFLRNKTTTDSEAFVRDLPLPEVFTVNMLRSLSDVFLPPVP